MSAGVCTAVIRNVKAAETWSFRDSCGDVARAVELKLNRLGNAAQGGDVREETSLMIGHCLLNGQRRSRSEVFIHLRQTFGKT